MEVLLESSHLGDGSACVMPQAATCGVEQPVLRPTTTWKSLRAMIEHEVHQRAQIYLMLDMLGVDTSPHVWPHLRGGP